MRKIVSLHQKEKTTLTSSTQDIPFLFTDESKQQAIEDYQRILEALRPEGMLVLCESTPEERKRYDFSTYSPTPIDQMEQLEFILWKGSNDFSCAHKVLELLKDQKQRSGHIPRIIISGLGGHATVIGRTIDPTKTSEAREFKKYLLELIQLCPDLTIEDVEKNIILEEEATNSGANVVNSERLLDSLPEEFNKVLPIAIVQTPLAQARSMATFSKQSMAWKPQKLYSCPPRYLDPSDMTDKELNYYLSYALRELSTTIGYMDKFCDPFEINTDVLSLLSTYLPDSPSKDAAKKFRGYYDKLVDSLTADIDTKDLITTESPRFIGPY